MRKSSADTALITVSKEGFLTGQRIVEHRSTIDFYVPSKIIANTCAEKHVLPYDCGIRVLTQKLFMQYRGLIYVAPTGIAVRSIAPYIKSKFTDPAVVAVDVRGRWVISLVSGHEGGANKLADDTARILNSEPIITTSTETVKTIIAGIGCRRNVSSAAIEEALSKALTSVNQTLESVRVVATVDKKKYEPGLLRFCEKYSLPLRVFSPCEIREARIRCEESEFVKKTLGIGAVAVPCAILAGKKTKLIKERLVWRQVTVAIAQEYYMW
jgi:cobalt-precorrin 5A hydrolase